MDVTGMPPECPTDRLRKALSTQSSIELLNVNHPVFRDLVVSYRSMRHWYEAMPAECRGRGVTGSGVPSPVPPEGPDPPRLAAPEISRPDRSTGRAVARYRRHAYGGAASRMVDNAGSERWERYGWRGCSDRHGVEGGARRRAGRWHGRVCRSPGNRVLGGTGRVDSDAVPARRLPNRRGASLVGGVGPADQDGWDFDRSDRHRLGGAAGR